MNLVLTKPLITKRLHLLFISKIVWGGREVKDLTVVMVSTAHSCNKGYSRANPLCKLRTMRILYKVL